MLMFAQVAKHDTQGGETTSTTFLHLTHLNARKEKKRKQKDRTEKKRREEKRKETTRLRFLASINEQPSITPGCREIAAG